ncbi:hypothetical protein M422DRAFT_72386 [Sphaerobolus stellatus SS14]|uniref:Uncharacterized protein n=1 Tax=Sphaerobolus stellatus (strain SS14) TaxID=990650 RepID=A0A0C9U5B8_SPHS4|nr:hypothetical protein M422DRAFT_72386 [Sphaerobolus stellatus SS14]
MNNLNALKPSALDWLSFPPSSPGDLQAPHPDLFDLELEASIGTLPQSDQEQLQLLNIELTDPYAFVRSNTPRCGPPSTFTVSSESTYGETYSSRSESVYSYSDYDSSATNYNVDLGIDFSKFSVDVDAAAAEAKEQLNAAAAATRVKDEPENAFSLLPKGDKGGNAITAGMFSVPYPPADVARHSSYHEGLRSAVTAANAAQSANDYYTSAIYNHKSLTAPQATISPSTLVPLIVPSSLRPMDHNSVSPTPSNNSAGLSASQLDESRDPRKKYKCPSCPRGKYSSSIHI